MLHRLRVLLPAALCVLLALPAQAIEAQKVVSDGGIEAWLVEDHSIPVISLDVGWRGGAALDPQGKEGLANMVSGLLDEGAGDLDSLQLRTILDNKAISLSFRAGQDSFSGALKTLTENRELAFDLLRQAMTAPRFDAEPVERIRSQIITGLTFEQEDPQTIASKAWNEMVFAGHPYARPVKGSIESVSGLTRADLRTFVGKTLVNDARMKIGVAGDVTAEELKRLLDKTFGALPTEGQAVSIADATPRTGGMEVIDKDIPQSVAVFGETGLPREDPDFYAAYVINYILGGGGFASQLMEEVREKRGLAYSVYSYLAPMDHAALLIGGTATNNARMKESLAVVREVWADMAENGPTEDELTNAKTYLTGAYPLRFTSTDNISAILMSLQMDGYPIDHLQTRNQKIEAVTLEDAKRAARRMLDPAELTVVVVGRPEGIAPAQAAE